MYQSWTNLRRSLAGQSLRDLASARPGQSGTWQHNRAFVSHIPDVLSFDFNAYPEFAFALGVCEIGLILYWGQLRIARFPWPRIVEISLHRSQFHLTVRETDEVSFQSTVQDNEILGPGRGRAAAEEIETAVIVLPPRPVIPAPVSIPEPSSSVLTSPEVRNRSATRPQYARIRHWLQCLIPRTVESDSPEATRPFQRRRRLRRDRSSLSSPVTNTRSPDGDACSHRRPENPDTLPSEDSPNEPWLRRDNLSGQHSSTAFDPGSRNDPGLRASAMSPGLAEATPTRSHWVSRAVMSRLNESPMVPTIRRVRSALTGSQRDSSGRTGAPSATRPVSFSAMHRRAVSNNTSRPIPPPRPKQPPTPSEGRPNWLTRSLTMSPSFNESGQITPNLISNLDSIPLVPTFTAVFTPDGRLVQTSRLNATSSVVKEISGNGLTEPTSEELAVIDCAPQQTSTPNHTKVSCVCVFVVMCW
ncbi:unnamed protein product [Echinostoma caproni]|uniref:FERM C-terminal PH-like domain-containing protein n=1 Tax=Echinostoma caproni TaxID=27848 RepID=A0A3P8I5E8_9TREM|nr:unnamed protein product [Echinostoma caproni]